MIVVLLFLLLIAALAFGWTGIIAAFAIVASLVSPLILWLLLATLGIPMTGGSLLFSAVVAYGTVFLMARRAFREQKREEDRIAGILQRRDYIEKRNARKMMGLQQKLEELQREEKDAGGTR